MNKCKYCKKRCKRKFCNHRCYWNFKRHKRVVRKCLNCSKEFIVRITSKQKYCSLKCHSSHQWRSKEYRRKMGKRTNWVTGLTKGTDERLRKRVEARYKNNNGKYHKEGFVNNFEKPEIREKAQKTIKKQRLGKTVEQIYGNEKGKELRKACGERTIKMLSEGKFPQVKTKPAMKLFEAIKGLGFVLEYPVDRCSVDICQPNKKLAIEVYGDYWHCNPQKYDKEYFHAVLKLQAKDIWKKDRRRRWFIRSQGYRTLYFWEKDLKINFDRCVSRITTALTNVL